MYAINHIHLKADDPQASAAWWVRAFNFTIVSDQERTGGVQHTIAMFNMYVGLPHQFKGTHMSRFVEVLESQPIELDAAGLRPMMNAMLNRLGATSGHIAFSFPCFLRKAAPVSGVESLLDHDVTLRASEDPLHGFSVEIEVRVAATSLCPCSKEISDYGAHNQRSHVTLTAKLAPGPHFVWIEELIDLAEDVASCELYGLLKRPDEKFVTERAYDNPKFVEDLVRDAAHRLNKDSRIAHYVVESENFESIHNHSAYAMIEKNKGA